MISRIDTFLTERDSLRKALQKEFVNPELSLNARWALFLRAEEILPIDSWIGKTIRVLSDNLYDDFHFDRHETVLYKDVDERIYENRTLEGDDPDEYSERWDEMYEKLDDFREAVLKSGVRGFVYDW